LVLPGPLAALLPGLAELQLLTLFLFRVALVQPLSGALALLEQAVTLTPQAAMAAMVGLLLGAEVAVRQQGLETVAMAVPGPGVVASMVLVVELGAIMPLAPPPALLQHLSADQPTV
jgi:hypothetical protein